MDWLYCAESCARSLQGGRERIFGLCLLEILFVVLVDSLRWELFVVPWLFKVSGSLSSTK